MRRKIILIVGVVAALTTLLVFTLTACGGGSVAADEAVYTNSDYQKPPEASVLAGLPNDSATIREYATAGDIIGLYIAADNNYSAMKQTASFVITSTNINVDSEARGAFAVEQRSSYAVVSNSEGRYVQTISGMQRLELGGLNLSGIASNFGYMNRNYYDVATKVTYNNNGGSPNFTDATNLAGATCKWANSTSATVASETSTGGLTDLEIAANDANLRSKTIKKDGKRIKRYVYKDEYMYLYALSGDELRAGGAPANRMWDPNANNGLGAYASYNIDYNWAKGNTSAKPTGEYGRKWPIGAFGKSNYQMDAEVLDLDACTITSKVDEASGKTYYECKFVWIEEQIDYACRYAKASLIGDINAFVAPFEMTYNKLETTIDIWEDGLYKKWVRIEAFETKADAILLGLGTGYANNTATEVFSYSDADTDVKGKYANDTFWKGFSAATPS